MFRLEESTGTAKHTSRARKTSFEDISRLCASLHPFEDHEPFEPLLLSRIHTCRQNELLSPCFKTGSCFTRRSARVQTKGNTRTSGCKSEHSNRGLDPQSLQIRLSYLSRAPFTVRQPDRIAHQTSPRGEIFEALSQPSRMSEFKAHVPLETWGFIHLRP